MHRQQEAMELRRMGVSYKVIGDRIGVSDAQAHRDVMAAIKRLLKITEKDAEIVQIQELDRLDRLMMSIWNQAQNGSLAAIDRILKIMERRAKLLGLDAPTKVSPTTKDGDDLPGGAVILPPIYNSVDEWLAAQQQNSKTTTET